MPYITLPNGREEYLHLFALGEKQFLLKKNIFLT